MNKKGFTLIELLAVIVILAIIALIATPIVLDIIKESKESSELRSAEFYIEAVEYSLAQSILNNQTINDGTYDILETGNLCLQYNGDKCINELVVKINGESPKEGKITISNGRIYSIITKFNNKNIAKYKDITPSYTTHKPGDIVYFNVSTGETCDESESVSTTGTKSGCMKFYVIKDLGGALDLILDHNTTSVIAWVNQGDYSNDENWNNDIKNNKGPITLLKQLKEDTKNWKGTLGPLEYINYRDNYVIDYGDYNARIITANEVAEITENHTWNEIKETSQAYSFHSLTSLEGSCLELESGCKYTWLYDRTSTECTSHGCLNNSDVGMNGYWTISSNSSSFTFAWYVYYKGYVGNNVVDNRAALGVRPVITILKTKIS